MKYTLLKLKKEEKIGYITINRPPANALSQKLIEELDIAFDQFQQDHEVKVIILHGEGRFFAAGADIKEFTQAAGKAEFTQMSSKGQHVFTKIEALSKPVIAVIHGAALGGGLELAMACHIRYVATDAKLGLPELQLGLIPGFTGTQRLPQLVGKAKAAELMLTSDPVLGEEAVRIGLANHAFPMETVLDEGIKLAKKISQKSAISMDYVLELLNNAGTLPLDIAQKKEAEKFGDISESVDAKEGIQAFIEKRQPKFKDR